jgi:cytochrome c oxidase accessory protein FixG
MKDTAALHPPEAVVTIGEHGKRKWIFADLPQGRFARARALIYSVLMLFYIGAPWIMLAGQPLLRFDLPARRYYIFGTTFLATDLYFLALFLLMAAVGMFVFSALLGRLWCGWACPQTVYLEGLFRHIERWIEGTPIERRKLDNGPRDEGYYSKKIVKFAIFGAITIVIALSFTAYFIGPQASFGLLAGGAAQHPAALVVALVIAAFVFVDFAWFREQFCSFLCPYARFQSVMLDDHSLIVGYDVARGEPRGPLRHGDPAVRGDCIDCKRCVQVCPTGIDIRSGLQLECVSCTACIDACDTVMERIGRPRGLVRYDSLAGLAGRPHRILRPRVALYAVMMAILMAVFAWHMAGREAVGISVARSPGMPYLVQEDGKVRNTFVLHISNVQAQNARVRITMDGPAGAELLVPGQPFEVAAGERISAEAFVMLPGATITTAETPLVFHLLQTDTPLATAHTVFLGPIFSGKR